MWMRELPVPETITEKEVHRMEKLISRKEAAKILGIRHVAVVISPMCSMWRMVVCILQREHYRNTLLAALIVQDLWIILQPTEREEYRNRQHG